MGWGLSVKDGNIAGIWTGIICDNSDTRRPWQVSIQVPSLASQLSTVHIFTVSTLYPSSSLEISWK